jgi:hypothetical protein
MDALFSELAGLALRGVVRSKVEATLPMSSFAEALQRSAQPARPGKILLKMA